MAKNVKKKKKVVVEATGQAHIHSSFNNIIISLTNNNGQVISWSSAGKMGFGAPRKTRLTLHRLLRKIAVAKRNDLGLRKIRAFVKGPGAGRESAMRALHNMGIEIIEIIDATPFPHNGCRPPKRRRV